MLNKEQIINTIENQLCIKSEKDFGDYFNRKLQEGVTDAEVALLSPDNIDNTAFWEYLESKYNLAVCGYNLGEQFSKDNADYMNYVLAVQSGITNQLRVGIIYKDMQKKERPIVLEIGPGYGNIYSTLKGWCAEYHMCDVYPRFDGIIKSNGHGIPEELKCRKYDHIFAFNVFQHLTHKQRLNHYRDIAELLDPLGSFAFTIQVDTDYIKKIRNTNHNQTYICHYGQYTTIPSSVNEVKEDICSVTDKLKLIQINQRLDGFSTMVFKVR